MLQDLQKPSCICIFKKNAITNEIIDFRILYKETDTGSNQKKIDGFTYLEIIKMMSTAYYWKSIENKNIFLYNVYIVLRNVDVL